jgi:hypothetical protein
MDDARWILARHAAGQLQGDRAAILPPARRRDLVDLGTRLGLRPFDCNLVLAIVQDAAREGHGLVGVESQSRLSMIRPAIKPWPWTGVMIAAACSLALWMMAIAINWLRG